MMDIVKPYPLSFKPFMMEKIWGGGRLKKWNRNIAHGLNIGETWEISDVKGKESIIANGKLKGLGFGNFFKTYLHHWFPSLIQQPFPLLIKLIDAMDDLSVQVHPDDSLAKALHSDPWGKTEMWYILETTRQSKIYCGLNKDISIQQFSEDAGFISKYLKTYSSQVNDAFYIPAGTVHAIGAGNLLLEVQRNSDRTYRIYDWDRVDKEGHKRELHLDQAKLVRPIQSQDHYIPDAPLSEDISSKEIVKCPWFCVRKNIRNNNHLKMDDYLLGRNVILFCQSGNGTIVADDVIYPFISGSIYLVAETIKNWTIDADPLMEWISITEFENVES